MKASTPAVSQSVCLCSTHPDTLDECSKILDRARAIHADKCLLADMGEDSADASRQTSDIMSAESDCRIDPSGDILDIAVTHKVDDGWALSQKHVLELQVWNRNRRPRLLILRARRSTPALLRSWLQSQSEG